jgi:Luciferase-like monooxygenase
MKFGVEIPTCTAGMMYPVPFATVEDVVRAAIEVEQLGYYDVAGNDHFSTQQYVRDAWPDPPDYFEPLLTLAYIAAKTSVLRLTTGILVLPMRQPVQLAKQVATLDAPRIASRRPVRPIFRTPGRSEVTTPMEIEPVTGADETSARNPGAVVFWLSARDRRG